MIRTPWNCVVLLLAGLLLVPGSLPGQEWLFIRGDFNGDGELLLDDSVNLLDFLFTGGAPPPCLDAADVNDDGEFSITDGIYLLNFQFLAGSPPPPAPFPDCGVDPTSDSFGCAGPLAACPEFDPPDLIVAFASPTAEDGDGIYLSRIQDPQTNFDALRLGMRPVTLDGNPAGGTLTISDSAGILELYRLDGTPLGLPTTIDSSELPLDLLLNGEASGRTTLVAERPPTGEADTVPVRVGSFPGLAGRETGEYPFFEFVVSFNDTEIVQTAVDPTRHSERDGLGYDIYVVESKSLTEWAADPTLVDVTGAVEMGIIDAAGSIEDQITTVWDTGIDGGLELGIGYDVVYDFGQDGTLDPGDLVSGLSDERAGFYIVGDLNLPGPFTVDFELYTGGSFLAQKTYYPMNLADLGELPLVVISHGNGHQYTWYDYLGNHLASYGYIVMSHQNNTQPGIETASTTTLTNTDYFLSNLATIAGGIFDGHVDGDRITWIGHSRGGEGVVRAYDRLFEGQFIPASYNKDDIVLISSIAPTVFNSVFLSDPHDRNYHLIAGAADGDVTGGADCALCQFFRIAEAGTGNVQVTYVQGADHNDFNCCGFQDGQGPAQIGRPAAQIVAKSYYLALVELYVKENPATRDYFTRMYQNFHPSGIGTNVICATQYRDARQVPEVIDDYQTELGLDISSSGGMVSFDVMNPWENFQNDINTTFSWIVQDPMNGMTQAGGGGDLSRGVVFDWSLGMSAFYEYEIVPDLQDFSDNQFLSFRVCQGTRHPETNGLAGTLDFTVTVEDLDGNSSSINFGQYGTITRPYQRTGLGGGIGWANEYNTVRIRLADFENDGSGVDLSRIAFLRFQFGDSFGSPRGRIGIDDVHLTFD